jgi:AraC-like DNA-binding protein
MLLSLFTLFQFASAGLCVLLGIYILVLRRPATLAIMLFAMSAQAMANVFTHVFNTHVFDFLYMLGFLYGPLYYFTIEALLSDSFRWNYQRYLHFSPLFIATILNLAGVLPWEKTTLAMTILLSLYLIGCYWRMRFYARIFSNLRASGEPELIAWLRNTLTAICLIGASQGLRVAVGLFSDLSYLIGLFFHIGFVVVLGALCIYGLRDGNLVPGIRRDEEQLNEQLNELQPESLDELPDIQKEDALTAALTALMATEKPYLNDNLSLADIAEQLHLSPRRFSHFMRRQFNCNFPEYINRLRVDEVKAMMANPFYKDTPVVDLGLQAGFNSRSSFNLMFKRITGEAPTVYWRRINTPQKI